MSRNMGLIKLIGILLLCGACLIDAANFRRDYEYYKETGGWLKLHTKAETWEQAKQVCKAEGAKLASPINMAISDAMVSLMSNEANVQAVHTDLLVSTDASDQEILKVLDDRMVLTKEGKLTNTRKATKNPFVCFNVEKENDVNVNECGTADNTYKLDNRTSSCYKFHSEQRDWFDAYKTCAVEGGRLLIINSAEEAQVIRELFAVHAPEEMENFRWSDNAFVGVHSLEHEGKEFSTIEGALLKETGYAKWSYLEPNNAAHDEYCVSVGRSGLLIDDPCSREFPFICEISPNGFGLQEATEIASLKEMYARLKRNYSSESKYGGRPMHRWQMESID